MVKYCHLAVNTQVGIKVLVIAYDIFLLLND